MRQRTTALIIAALVIGLAPVAAAAADVKMKETALVVGNLNFGPTDAILWYDGKGAPVDIVIPMGAEGLSLTCCMQFGPDDNLYVADTFASRVLRFDGLTGEYIDEFIPVGSGGLIFPLVLVFHEGHLYVGDPAASAIRRYDAATGAYVGDFVPPGDHGMIGGEPQHFAFGPDQKLYVAAEMSHRILRYDGETGAFVDEFSPASSGFLAPSGLVFGPDGLLYVDSAELNEVRRFDVWSGALIDTFVPAGSGGLSVPVGLAFGPDGDLYVSSSGTSQILRYDGKKGTFRGVFVDAGVGGLTAARVVQFKSTVTVCRKGETLLMGYLTAVSEGLKKNVTLGACE